MGWFPLCVVTLVLIRLLAQLALEALNRSEVRRHAALPPPALSAVMDAATYAKSLEYTLAKSRLNSVEAAYSAGVLLALLFSGVLPWLWARFDRLGPGAAWSGALFMVAAMLLFSVPDLPLSWWTRFRLEARFGFNRSTLRLWVADHAKFALLMMVIGVPIAWSLLALVKACGPFWWVWGFALVFGVQLLLMVLYPKIILPLFNTLAPLPEGEQRASLLSLSERTGFRAKTIDVMDGSRRSGHSNAFFTGFGRFRRIVLYDTLVAQLAADELEAVLAHEIGHYKCRHIPRHLALMALLQFGAFALVAWLARASWFNAAFGLPSGALAPAFLLFVLLAGLATFWFAPLGNWLSRRNEFEADAFARRSIGSSAPLIGALRKLSQENLSNLTPHPVYSMAYYSHPTLAERERALLV